MDTRRGFIRKSAVVAASVTLMPSAAFRKRNPKTGLILYTVRQDMSRDAAGTIEAVSRMGYDWIEAAGYNNGMFHGLSPRDFRKVVMDNGMQLLSSHSSINIENAERVSDAVSEAGIKYLILPSLPGAWSRSTDGFKEAAEFMNRAGEVCRKKGLKFGFHNHSVEFREIDGIVPFDILATETDPELVLFEIDLCWITAAGKNPVDYFRKYPGRFELWHIKDMTPEGRDATLGEGVIDFGPIFAEMKLSGMKYHFIEQDNCVTHTPLESARISREYLIESLL